MNRVIAVRVGGQAESCVLCTGESVTLLHGFNYYGTGLEENTIESWHIRFPDYATVPFPLLQLLRLTYGHFYFNSKILKFFDQSWRGISRAHNAKRIVKENNEMTSDKPFISHKALMLMPDITHINSYDAPVFLHTSTDGVKRMNFMEYLHEVEREHDGVYKMEKVCRSQLSEMDQSHYDIIVNLTTPVNGDKRGTVYMCFRALWYAATKEMMPASC